MHYTMHRRLGWLFCVITVAFGWLSETAAAADKPLTVLVRPPLLTEAVQQSVDTAGVEFVGLAGGRLDRRASSSDLIVFGLRPSDKTLCVNIQRSSGLYRAKFEYRIEEPAAEIQFQIRGSRFNKMKVLAGELAIRAQASASARCNSAAPFLPVRWAGSTFSGNTVLFNSRQGTEVSVSTASGVYVGCQSLRDAANDEGLSIRSFDTVCRAPMVTRCRTDQAIRVTRADGLEYDKPKTLLVRSPC